MPDPERQTRGRSAWTGSRSAGSVKVKPVKPQVRQEGVDTACSIGAPLGRSSHFERSGDPSDAPSGRRARFGPCQLRARPWARARAAKRYALLPFCFRLGHCGAPLVALGPGAPEI
eukprot:14027802-Alexandrium_andersonii.AAC.1